MQPRYVRTCYIHDHRSAEPQARAPRQEDVHAVARVLAVHHTPPYVLAERIIQHHLHGKPELRQLALGRHCSGACFLCVVHFHKQSRTRAKPGSSRAAKPTSCTRQHVHFHPAQCAKWLTQSPLLMWRLPVSLVLLCHIPHRPMQHSDTVLTETEVAQQHHSQPNNARHLCHAMVQDPACKSKATAPCYPAAPSPPC